MSHFPYNLAPDDETPVMGLIVLQTDETIERDFRRIFAGREIDLYVSRVRSEAEVTGETLASMSENLPSAARLFPDARTFDVVGYGCTSGSAVIGPDQIAALVKSTCNAKQVTEPLSALVAMCENSGVKNLGILSPYVASVSQTLRDALAERGIATPVFGSFDEAEEAKVVRISGQSIFDAAVEVGRSPKVDAVFLSCTNLRTLDELPKIEAALAKPVFSSNQVLAWHMAKLAGV